MVDAGEMQVCKNSQKQVERERQATKKRGRKKGSWAVKFQETERETRIERNTKTSRKTGGSKGKEREDWTVESRKRQNWRQRQTQRNTGHEDRGKE